MPSGDGKKRASVFGWLSVKESDPYTPKKGWTNGAESTGQLDSVLFSFSGSSSGDH